MRLRHFEAFAPVCPLCRASGQLSPLLLANILERSGDTIIHGVLHCSTPSCAREYPIIESIPVIAPDTATQLANRATEILLRDDLPDTLASLLGDAVGPDSWLDVIRRTLSTYAWDAYAGHDPEEPEGPVRPGAASRCLAALLELHGTAPPAGRILDLGCGAGGASFALAAGAPDALVLGIDLGFALLRTAQRAAAGQVSYPRRRIGLVYDQRHFPVSLPGADCTDFWCCDAGALPLADGASSLVAALNLLDCVPSPRALLAEIARVAAPGAPVLLATPFDWTERATPRAHWVGGHSQRAPHGGAGEDFLRSLVTPGAHPQSVPGFAVRGTRADFPWGTRLHERSHIAYSTYLLALERLADA